MLWLGEFYDPGLDLFPMQSHSCSSYKIEDDMAVAFL